ncbi:hypothetical protein Tco_1158399, partial [Tanacetum coccineum]
YLGLAAKLHHSWLGLFSRTLVWASLSRLYGFDAFCQAVVYAFDLSVGLWMLDGCKSLFDVQFFTLVFEWIIFKQLSVVGYDFPWKTESAYYDPSWISLITYSAWTGPTHRNHGSRNDLQYRTPLIKAYCLDFILIVCAFFVSTGSVPSVSTSTKTCLVKWEKLVEAILLSAYAFLFSLRGTSTRASNLASLLDASNSNLRSYVNSTLFGFIRMSLAPDPSRHDGLSVNRVHGSRTTSSTCISTSEPYSSGISAMKSARNWPQMVVLSL